MFYAYVAYGIFDMHVTRMLSDAIYYAVINLFKSFDPTKVKF